MQSPHDGKPHRYIGIMSGTSLDAVDVVSVLIDASSCRLEHNYNHPIPAQLKQKIIACLTPSPDEMNRVAQLDRELGILFSDAVIAFLSKYHLTAADVVAIGSHGQTIRHFPEMEYGFSLQVGDANTIAVRTGINVVADFRKKDIALGGQGAPLVPAFHQHIFSRQNTSSIVLNIGGIANLTFLPYSGAISGFDTGPGNTLIDQWFQKHHCAENGGSQQLQWDQDGHWARSGKVITPLLEAMLADEYFSRSGPKSTGREYFNLPWLQQKMQLANTLDSAPKDVQRTLTELTAISIVNAINQAQNTSSFEQLILCGGGAYNQYLRDMLQAALPQLKVTDSTEFGIAVDWVEAAAFAWFAHCFIEKMPSNIPEVTGASRLAVLGCYFPAQ